MSDAAPDLAHRRQRARFRAWHRGTREADYMFGGYFDRYVADGDEPTLAWFEALLQEEDVDVMAWALGTAPLPDRFAGDLGKQLCTVDYVDIPR